MKYYVYLLENAMGRHYVGISTDPDRRVKEHNKGNTKSTRPFRPWRVIYIEEHENRSAACKREWYLKHAKGYKDKIKIINEFGGIA